MAFSLSLANGEMHGFQYFNVDNLKYAPKSKGEFISFDHRGKVVVILGVDLRPIYQAIVQQTLVSVHESALAIPTDAGTHIKRIEITSV